MWFNLFSKLLQFIPNKNWCYRLPPALFNISLTASIVILAVLITRFPLRKAPRIYSYALWAVVAFRLICPVSFSSSFSLLGAMDAPVSERGQVEYVPVDIVHDAQPSVDLIIPEVTDTVNERLPSPWEQIADPLEAPAAIASWIWLIGVGIMLLWALSSYLNLRQMLLTAVLLNGNVFQSEHVASPFILGLFRPRIYIPFGLDESTRNYVLSHERYHLKRLDHIVKLFSFILLAIYWFNPLCWLAFHLMSKDMEMSCDEKVLLLKGNDKIEYSTVLLSFAVNRRFPSPSPLAFGETSAKSRIKNALKWKQPKVWASILAGILCIVVIAACTANPIQKEPAGSGTPYEWTSTVQASDIQSIRVQPVTSDVPYSMTLNNESSIEDLTSILNQIPPESIYAGRGIPAQLSVTIVEQGQTIYLNYGGDLVEISLLGKYRGSVWEIHDDALNTLMKQWLDTAQQEYQDYEQKREDQTEIIPTQPTYDLTENGLVHITADKLPSYRFKTNSTKILVELVDKEEPVVLRLHATDAQSPIMYFSTENNNLSSCSFSNLTSAREYYLSADCAADTQFVISDGGEGALFSSRIHPLTGE